MPCIQQKNRDGRGEQGGVAGQQTHRQILSGAGKQKDRHGQRPQRIVAGFIQQDAEAGTQKQISGQNRNRVQKHRFQSFSIH